MFKQSINQTKKAATKGKPQKNQKKQLSNKNQRKAAKNGKQKKRKGGLLLPKDGKKITK